MRQSVRAVVGTLACAAFAACAAWQLEARADQPVDRASSEPSHYLVIRLTADAFGTLTDRKIDKVSGVNEMVLGTHVVGNARTVGQPQVKLQERPTEAGFMVELSGTTTSRTRGYNGPVVIRSRTTTHFTSRKYVVFVPGEGFRSGPATTQARTQSVTEGIDPQRGGLIGRIIERKASEAVAAQRGQSEAIARERTIRRVNKLFDDYLEGRLAALNQRVAMISTIAILRGNVGEPITYCCSTPDHVLIALARGRDEFNVKLPELNKSQPPIQFWMHKSLFGGEVGQKLLSLASTGLAAKGLLDWSRGMMPDETFTALSASEEFPKLKMALETADDWYVLEFGERPAPTLARAQK